MKIKKSFITNSSSSSYILVGQYIDINNLPKKKPGKILCLGKYLYEGDDVFDLTEGMLEVINKIEDKSMFNTLRFVEYVVCDYDSGELPLKSISNIDTSNLYVISGECDQHSTDRVEDFINRYITWDKKVLNPQE